MSVEDRLKYQEDDIPLNLSSCIQISEAGETSQVKGRKKLVNYKSPIPKTKLTRALLIDNICDSRKLEHDLLCLSATQRKEGIIRERHIQAFAITQDKKRHSWQREDESRLSKLNLPHLHAGSRAVRSASLKTVYELPKNLGMPVFSVPLLPVKFGEPEQRVVEYHDQIFLTRLPTIMRLTSAQRVRYDKYKGAELQDRRTVNDERFQSLIESLSTTKGESIRKHSKRDRNKLFLTRSSTFH